MGERYEIAHCPTCGHCAWDPTRRIRLADGMSVLAQIGEAGEVVEGCVDGFHDAYADAWHVRSDAESIRAAERLRRTDIGEGAEYVRARLAAGTIPGMTTEVTR